MIIAIKKIASDKKCILKWLCLAVIIIWPIYNSFYGIDLVDTGYYLYQYQHPLSDYGSYTTFLATVIGAVWLRLFEGLGLWGLNLLEILLEWTVCIIVYYSFNKRFGKTTTLIGITITILAISTYVNIFNYHQLNMASCCTMLCLMYKALDENLHRYLFLSGCMGMLAIACRMPSILTLVCILCIIYWNLFVDKTGKQLGKRILCFLSGYLAMAILLIAALLATGLAGTVFKEILRLGNLGASGSGAYGGSSMIHNFIIDTFWSVLATILFTIAILVFIQIDKWQSSENGKYIRRVVEGIVILLLLPITYLCIYVVGHAPNYVQLTSFSWFLYGSCVEISIFYIIRGIVVKEKEERKDGVIALMAIALILLCTVGSATRAKHVILGLWIIVPFVGEKIRKATKDISWKLPWKINEIIIPQKAIFHAKIFIAIIATLSFSRFVLTTNNFDSTNRTELTTSINSSKLKYIKTTQREAEAVSSVLEALEKQDEDRQLIVIGNGVMFYYLSDYDSYVKPWISGTSYMYDELYEDICERTSIQEKRPLVLVCKTNPYLGFSEDAYEKLYQSENANSYSGKKDFIFRFMSFYKYSKVYENDYFCLYKPSEIRELMIWR